MSDKIDLEWVDGLIKLAERDHEGVVLLTREARALLSLARLGARAEKLAAACRKLTDYARRNRTNWQTDKFLDYVRMIDAALAAPETKP
jgi:hypothetical protein